MDRFCETADGYATEPNYLLIADRRTYEAAGSAVEELVKRAGAEVNLHIVQDYEMGESPKTDDVTKDSLLRGAPKSQALLAVGSGVINGLTKWVAFERDKPFFAVVAAASMNGYAFTNAAATVDGLKILSHANAGKGIFAVPETIENAPFEPTASVLGDVAAKSVSSADWKMNRFLFGEYCCQNLVDLIGGLEPVCLENSQKIAATEPGAIEGLFEAPVFPLWP